VCNGAVLGTAASVTANCAFERGAVGTSRQSRLVGGYGIGWVFILVALWLNLLGGFVASRRPRS